MDHFVQLLVCKSNDIDGLRTLYNKIEISVRNLTSLDVTRDQWGAVLIRLISAKFPQDLKLTISRTFKDMI